jgi:hypothetical protein
VTTDGRSLLAQVIREAGRLGLAPWERLVLIVVVAFLLVLGRRGFDAVRALAIVSPPEPTRENDGGGPPLPDATWDVEPNTEPGSEGGG